MLWAKVRRLARATAVAFRAKIRWQRSPRNSFSFDKCPVSVWHDERSLVVAFSIYSCIGLAQVLCAGWRRAARPGGYTYYVINPRPPSLAWVAPPGPPRVGRAGRAVLAPGFLVPAPHGHSLRTGLRVVPPPVALRPAPTSHSIRVSFVTTILWYHSC